MNTLLAHMAQMCNDSFVSFPDIKLSFNEIKTCFHIINAVNGSGSKRPFNNKFP